MKRCLICKEVKTVESFRPKQSYCKPCQNAFAKQWCQDNRDHVREQKAARYKGMTPEQRWDQHLRGRYGITNEEYERLIIEQGGVCAICSQSSTRHRLSVDHCHATGKVRGLLCERCNSVLGRMKDNAELLELAAEYLRVWVAK